MSKLALSNQELNHNGLVIATPAMTCINGMDGQNELLLPARKDLKPVPGRQSAKNGVGIAASDTPFPSAPSSPKL